MHINFPLDPISILFTHIPLTQQGNCSSHTLDSFTFYFFCPKLYKVLSHTLTITRTHAQAFNNTPLHSYTYALTLTQTRMKRQTHRRCLTHGRHFSSVSVNFSARLFWQLVELLSQPARLVLAFFNLRYFLNSFFFFHPHNPTLNPLSPPAKGCAE